MRCSFFTCPCAKSRDGTLALMCAPKSKSPG
jgi:hypothetical protein